MTKGVPARKSAPNRLDDDGGRRYALILAFASLAFLIATLTIFKMSNNDIWIHLKTGEIILQTGHVPDKDPYSFTASDHDYVAHEWLSGVLCYLVYAAAGVNGLIIFKSAIIFATCAALIGACYFLRVSPVMMFPCFILMLYIGSARFLVRPHIFSYLFIALYLLCYFGYRRRRVRAWLFAIPFLHTIWTNLHGGHFQGILLLGLMAAGETALFLRARWGRLSVQDALPGRDLILVLALPFACLVMALVNPYHYRLLTFPFELTGQELFMRSIYEWQSALFPSYNHSSMFFFYIPWTIVLFGSFLFVRDHSELKGGLREGIWAMNVLLTLAWIVFSFEFAGTYNTGMADMPTLLEKQQDLWFVVTVVLIAANVHRLEFTHLGIASAFFALSMKHNRAVTDAVIVGLPTLGHNLTEILARMRRSTKKPRIFRESRVLLVLAILMTGLGVFTLTKGYYFAFQPPSKRESDMGIASNMPVGAVDYIVRNHITGRCLPSYNAAAMLIHAMWPEVKVAMDSRNDVYGEKLYREYVMALNGRDTLDAYIRKWDIDFFLITYVSDRSPALRAYFKRSSEWFLVYFDDRQLVYLRDRPRFRDIIRR
ncbi:MAG: hypothetical protein ACE5HU_06125, partial [Acidobacteriota bacterium]